ncbi:hypothetical protein I552_3697 [Mycobacterium xenopi 3993]|nr:hypothetical protein I552_3697 [Mycobacterium xenopi 3993]
MENRLHEFVPHSNRNTVSGWHALYSQDIQQNRTGKAYEVARAAEGGC